MNKITIGKSNVISSPIGLGTNAVGGHNLYPNLDEEKGKELVREALRSGINLLDTAYIYGLGRSEELIGEVLQDFTREEVVIATKAAHKQVNVDFVFDNSPEFLTRSVDESLKRLQTDYIDIFYIHFPDEATPKNEAVHALNELKKAGKIRAIGVSNFSLEQLEEANRDGLVDVLQGEYHLLNRSAEQTFFPYTAQNKITFIPFFPLASGLLAGKYNEQTRFPEGDLRSEMPHFQGAAFKENIAKVNRIKLLANKYGVDIPHIVLAWYLHRPEIDLVIPGAKNAKQVADNLQTARVKLTDHDFELIDRLFS